MKTAIISLCCLLLALVQAGVVDGEDTGYDYYEQDHDYVRSIREETTPELYDTPSGGEGVARFRTEDVDGTLQTDPQDVAPRADDVQGTNWETDPQDVAPRADDVQGTNWETDYQDVAPRADDVQGTNWETDPQDVAPRADDVQGTNWQTDPQAGDPRGEEVGGLPLQSDHSGTDVKADDAPEAVPEGEARQDDLGGPDEEGDAGNVRNDVSQPNDTDEKDRSAKPRPTSSKASSAAKKKPKPSTVHSKPPSSSWPSATWGQTAVGCPPCWSWVLGWYIPQWCKSCSVNWPWLCWLCNWSSGFWWCRYCY